MINFIQDFFKRDKPNFNVVHTLISEETIIKGNVNFSGSLLINGEILGNIFGLSSRDRIDTIRIGKTAKIKNKGVLHAQHIIISGNVECSSVICPGTLIIESSANIKAKKIEYSNIVIQRGAQINSKLVSL